MPDLEFQLHQVSVIYLYIYNIYVRQIEADPNQLNISASINSAVTRMESSSNAVSALHALASGWLWAVQAGENRFN